MSWSQVSERRWERPVSGMEGYFIFSGSLTASLCEGRQHYTLFSKLKLDINLPDRESALRQAWKQMRYEQPHLSTIADGMKLVYEVLDDAAVQEWLDATFIVSSAANAEELHQADQTIKQSTLFYIPRSSELLFRAYHHTIDGTGVILFWNEYLKALASPAEKITFGDEPSRLAPSIEKALGVPSEPTPEQSEKASALLADYVANVPGIAPVSKVGVAPSGSCRNAELLFSVSTTEAIVRACKAKGITVTAAIHAAYIRTLVRHADPDSNAEKYVSANQFNLRSYLPEPYSTGQYAVAVFYTTHPFVVHLPASFWDLAYTLNVYYATAYKNNREALELNGHFTRALFDIAQTPEFLAGPVPKDALVSSLGVAERYLKRSYGDSVAVHDFKLGVDVVLGMSMLFAYTFQDRLRLVYSFNDGFEEPAHIEKYLQSVQEILETDLLA